MHNKEFVAKIEGVAVFGKIHVSKNGMIYLLQDKKQGSAPGSGYDNNGYLYSWKIGTNLDPETLDDMSVSEFKIIDTSKIKEGFKTKHKNEEVTVCAYDGQFGYVVDNTEEKELVGILPASMIFMQSI